MYYSPEKEAETATPEETILEIAEVEKDWKGPQGSHQLQVTEWDITEILSSWTGIPVYQLTEEERELFGAQLGSILAYVEKLNELDTSQVEPTAHTAGLSIVFRQDAVRPSTPRREILANAPAKAYGCYLVPKILD